MRISENVARAAAGLAGEAVRRLAVLARVAVTVGAEVGDGVVG